MCIRDRQLSDRESRNIVRLGYYDMERVGRRLSTIAPQYYGLGLTLGWCAKGVDSLARRCNLDAFVWPDGDLDALGYREVWDANFLATEVASARLSSLIHGCLLYTSRHDLSTELFSLPRGCPWPPPSEHFAPYQPKSHPLPRPQC